MNPSPGRIWAIAVLCSLTLLSSLVVAAVRAGDDSSTALSSGSGDAGAPAGGRGGGQRRAASGAAVAPRVPTANQAQVEQRDWPDRVLATRGWSASISGVGDRMVLSAPGVVVGGLSMVKFSVETEDPRLATPPTTSITHPRAAVFDLADGTWFPQGEFGLEASGDLQFNGPPDPGVDLFPSVVADEGVVGVSVGKFESVLANATGPVVAIGTFVQRDGRQADRLTLPKGTRLTYDCPPDELQARRCNGSGPATILSATVTPVPGTTIRAKGNGEVAIAGSVAAEAMGRSWTGQVVALEAASIDATAVFGNGGWALTGTGAGARQVWIDVWPVIDTQLSARSVTRRPGNIDSYSLRIQWSNIGYATSQIFEAEGRGPGASQVGFDLNKTSGHDAGVGVRRGDRVIGMKGGGDIDSNLEPGDSVDRGLSYQPGTSATVVLRGNFAEVAVDLPIPPA